MHIPAPTADLEPYHHEGRWYVRQRHNVVHSPRLRAFDACIGDLTRGRRYRGRGARSDELDVHTALREAARECHRRIGGG